MGYPKKQNAPEGALCLMLQKAEVYCALQVLKPNGI
jgi:hypothetical protein